MYHVYFKVSNKSACLRPDFTSNLVHVLTFGTPKFYIAPYDKIKHELVNLSSNCDVKSGLSVDSDLTTHCTILDALMLDEICNKIIAEKLSRTKNYLQLYFFIFISTALSFFL